MQIELGMDVFCKFNPHKNPVTQGFTKFKKKKSFTAVECAQDETHAKYQI